MVSSDLHESAIAQSPAWTGILEGPQRCETRLNFVPVRNVNGPASEEPARKQWVGERVIVEPRKTEPIFDAINQRNLHLRMI